MNTRVLLQQRDDTEWQSSDAAALNMRIQQHLTRFN